MALKIGSKITTYHIAMLPIKSQKDLPTQYSNRDPGSSKDISKTRTLLVQCGIKVYQSDHGTYSLLKSIACDHGSNAFRSFAAVLVAFGVAVVTLMTPKFGKEFETDPDVRDLPLSFAILMVGIGCLLKCSNPTSEPSSKSSMVGIGCLLKCSNPTSEPSSKSSSESSS